MGIKEDFIGEAEKIKRKGIEEFLTFLKSTDFFTAPASTTFHGSVEGGLVLHSLSVSDVMKELNDMTQAEQDEESILICGLFHDVCKTNFYKRDDREASKAQINFMMDLCEQKGFPVVPKSERTSGHVSRVIEALLEDKPIPSFKTSFKVEDKLPMGHGEKSVYIINKYMQLKDEEALAIRWHLGGFDPGVNFPYPSGAPQKQAFRENKLVPMLMSADMITSYLMDEW